MKFNLFIDKFKPVWWRYNVVIEAENQEEAIEKAKSFDCEIIDTEEICDDNSGLLIMDEELNTLYEE